MACTKRAVNLKWLRVWFLVVLFFANLSFASNKIDGAYHTLLIDANQNLWGWGTNAVRQLGDNTNENKNKPIKITSNTQYQAINVGVSHSIALDRDENIWVWDGNYYGQLGDGTNENKNKPTKLTFNHKFQAIAAKDFHTIAIDEYGNVLSWGINSIGQFGNEGDSDKNTSQKILSLRVNSVSSDSSSISSYSVSSSSYSNTKFDGYSNDNNKISVGDDYTVIIDNNQNIWSWGGNINGQLGDGSEENRLVPTKIRLDQNIKFKSIAASRFHTVALDNDGNVWNWGYGFYGQLGDGKDALSGINIHSYVPKKVFFNNQNLKFQAIAAGDDHTVALDVDGNIWGWGRNNAGQLADDSFLNNKTSPIKLDLKDTKFKAIACGMYHTIAIDIDGNIWSWGWNYSGQLGDGTFLKTYPYGRSTPKKITLENDIKFQTIAGGTSHTLALDVEGNIWSWGSNSSGELGDGTTKESAIPKKINFENGTKFKAIEAGDGSSVALDVDGNIWVWGNNSHYQLSSEDSKTILIPKKLTFDENIKFKAIATKELHTAAIDTNDNVWTWGINWTGALGDGTKTDRPIPKKVFSLNTTSSSGLDSSTSSSQSETQDFLIPLNQGWNLIATPIEVTLKKNFSNEFPEIGTQSFSTLGEYEVIWLYTDGNWLKNPDIIEPKKGYWLKTRKPYKIKFSGSASNLLASDIKNGWNLVGSGTRIENPKERLNVSVIWVYRDNNWIKNPNYIDVSEGVWIKK